MHSRLGYHNHTRTHRRVCNSSFTIPRPELCACVCVCVCVWCVCNEANVTAKNMEHTVKTNPTFSPLIKVNCRPFPDSPFPLSVWNADFGRTMDFLRSPLKKDALGNWSRSAMGTRMSVHRPVNLIPHRTLRHT